MFDWILATFPAPFWTTVLVVIIVGAGAALVGWSIGFDQGWDRRVARSDALDRVPDALDDGSRLLWEAQAFARGVDAGTHAERERQRQVRSDAGHKATATRRNKHTGQVMPEPVAHFDAGEGVEE